ncbi:MAG TPA: DUF5060 domain-containing protein [Draconibacterium sp.]|nr:DUF5060 domain-containing protein [Draconibacterium sp.]
MKNIGLSILVIFLSLSLSAQQKVSIFNVFELSFKGKEYSAMDSPTRDVNLNTTWVHESGSPVINLNGFYDGDGEGGAAGNVFKVRFCPVKTGKWRLTHISSNDEKLNGQNEGFELLAEDSGYPGFWEVDDKSPGSRWYKRSNAKHQYLVGNTLYTFLSEYFKGEPTGGNIKSDVLENSNYFKKIRFCLTGDTYPNPTEKPFLDEEGNPSDNGDYSHRPNPKWFLERVDLAVQTGFTKDLVCDLIINGPDTEFGRSMLRAAKNNVDYKPWLKYIAARYGSYPNVWICLSNEFDIKKPRFKEEDIMEIGNVMKKFLAYPTPLSVHGNSGDWNDRLNGDWNDHIIIQNKLKDLVRAAQYNQLNYYIGGKKPIINDELAYEGEGDGWIENDVIEAMLGAFVGGGYGSTGHKPASKQGHYFRGNFKAEEHRSADNLKWMQEVIDQNISFWKMKPVFYTSVSYQHKDKPGGTCGIFYNVDNNFCGLEWPGNEYVLATNKRYEGIRVNLPEGKFKITAYNLVNTTEIILYESAQGRTEISSSDSRAALIHVKRID